MTNLKTIFYEEKEIQDIMKKYYQIKIKLIISILFLIQHNCILSRLVVYKKAYDISRKGLYPRPTPTSQQNHKNTNHCVYLFFIIYFKFFEYYYKLFICYWVQFYIFMLLINSY